MTSPIMKFFTYAHLPEKLQLVSKPIGELAETLDRDLPDGAEKSTGLRKLLEAKDAFVRAALPVILLVVALVLSACASSAQPSDLANRAQLGEGNKDSTAAMFGSVATSREQARLSDRDAQFQNGGEAEEVIPLVVWNPETKKNEQALSASGQPLFTVKKIKGFRDQWNFYGSTITQSVTGTGTTSGSQSQAGTQSPTATPTNNPNIPVNVSGLPTGGP